MLAVSPVLAACSGPRSSQGSTIPYIPPAYYECTPITPADLLSYYYYYNRYQPVPNVEQDINNHLFVFKNIEITESALKVATSDYIWVDGFVQCYYLIRNAGAGFRAGERYDVVGMNAGLGHDYAGTLIFTGCIFVPAGKVQLPAADGGGLTVVRPY